MMSGKCKRIIKAVVFILLILLILGVAFYNVKKCDNFWDISVGSCLTLIVALVVSYYFTKKNQDEKAKKEVYFRLMQMVQNLVSDNDMFCIQVDSSKEHILMRKRELCNYSNLLKNNARDFGLEKEMDFIKNEVDEYSLLIGEHIDDLEYLSKSLTQLKRPLELIEQKLSESMLKLFD